LPDSFDRLEELRIAGEGAAWAVQDAKERIEEVECEFGPLAQLGKKAAASQQQLLTAAKNYEVVQSLVPQGLDAAGLDAEMDSLRSQFDVDKRVLSQVQLDLEDASSALSALQSASARSEETSSQTKARLADLNRRLSELSEDGLGDRQRAEDIHRLRIQLAAALGELTTAEQAVTALGPAIGEDEISALERNLEGLLQRVHEKQEALAADRREVCTICGEDPQGTIDQLRDEIAALDARLADHDRKLAALVLFQMVLAAERQCLARLIAAPLNDCISPWLKQLRGADSRLEFDPETSRITRIITDSDSGPIELPFDDHSEGMKGQVSLLVRLTLARVIAQQTGGRHVVILDDPLTETSPDRRPEMFRVLQQAAQDLQILFVTCHDDVLATLPGQSHILEL
jgi:uncharacterized protein YhaN